MLLSRAERKGNEMTYIEVNVNVDGVEMYSQEYPGTDEGEGQLTQFVADMRLEATQNPTQLYEVYILRHEHEKTCGEDICLQYESSLNPDYVWNQPPEPEPLSDQ